MPNQNCSEQYRAAFRAALVHGALVHGALVHVIRK